MELRNYDLSKSEMSRLGELFNLTGNQELLSKRPVDVDFSKDLSVNFEMNAKAKDRKRIPELDDRVEQNDWY